MSPEERQLVQGLFDRMRTNANSFRDDEADRMIADNIRQQPHAPYFLAQTVIVQDQALQAANARLQDLEQQLRDQQGHDSQGQPQHGSFLSGLFGGAPQAPEPPPSRPVWNQGGTSTPLGGGYPQGGAYPQGGGYPQGGYPPPQEGPWGGGQPSAGGGFLRGALGTAAGVAGGVLMADSIRSLFGGSHGAGGLGITSGVPGMGGGETTVNNFYDNKSDTPDASHASDTVQDATKAYDSNNGLNAADWNPGSDQDQDDTFDTSDMSDFSDDA